MRIGHHSYYEEDHISIFLNKKNRCNDGYSTIWSLNLNKKNSAILSLDLNPKKKNLNFHPIRLLNYKNYLKNEWERKQIVNCLPTLCMNSPAWGRNFTQIYEKKLLKTLQKSRDKSRTNQQYIFHFSYR